MSAVLGVVPSAASVLGPTAAAAGVEAPSDAAECAHCGLPLGRRPVSGTVDGERARCCCYGCLLALQVTRARGDSGAAAAVLVRLGLAVFFAVNVMMVSTPTYVPYVYGTAAPADGSLFQVLRVLALVFAAPVLLLLGWPILASAGQSLRAGAANADALIMLGTLAAYTLSVANTIAGRPAVYFDTAAMLLVLVTLGRYLEASAKAEAGAAVRAALAPGPACALRILDGALEPVAPDALAPGDVVQVGAGDAFPTDAVVVDGTGGVDEAALTGESAPVVKRPGSAIAGGTCSVDGLFRVRVTAPAAASAAARIAALLADARRTRTHAERVGDRIASVLVPLVVAIACAAGLFWARRAGVDSGVLTALAVLVVACPCALGIATPVALWTGLTTAARRGVIVRSAPALERAAAVRHVLFDKTGTLTSRTPRLVAIEPVAGVPLAENDILAIAAALEHGLTHPLARAVMQAWESSRDDSSGEDTARAARAVRVVPGRGVRGLVDDAPVALGGVRFAEAEIGLAPGSLARYAIGAGTVVLVLARRRLLGALRFVEQPRAEAPAALAALRSLGVRVGLLSGDGSAAAVVPALIAPGEAVLGLVPEDKVAWVRALRAPGVSGAVAMVGDGTNDAPALAAADLGIAVGGATDLARVTADVAILGDDLARVPWLVAYARRVRGVVRQNLLWAFGYNAVAVALAAAGALTPLVAAAAMLASSLFVVANARRLRGA